jgi:hypothetical protein
MFVAALCQRPIVLFTTTSLGAITIGLSGVQHVFLPQPTELRCVRMCRSCLS